MATKKYELETDPAVLAGLMNEYEELARKTENMPEGSTIDDVIDSSVATCVKLFEFMQALMPPELALDITAHMFNIDLQSVEAGE